MPTTRHLVGTLTDSLGQAVAVSGDVQVYSLPTVTLTGVPATATKGQVITGKIVGTVDTGLTVKSMTVTVDGVSVPVAADGTFTFTA